MRILGIETSCDETGVAIYDDQKGLVADYLHSQVAIHQPYGGVVPELASRDHIRYLLPLIHQALATAKLTCDDLDAIAYTAGPGLMGALLTGCAVGRSLAYACQVPAIPIHHMEAHLLAVMLEEGKPSFPFIALLVSGGHTQLVQATQIGQYDILGETVDDAVGEAFDKTAKLLGLGYPGGAPLSALAEQGDSNRFHFPRPMTDRAGLDFSFSGLKTHVLRCVQSHDETPQTRADIARCFVDAVVDTFVIKVRRALDQTKINQLVIAGGVGANTFLRIALKQLMDKRQGKIFYPRPEFCTDNGAMIAYAGYCHLQAKNIDQSLAFHAYPRWAMSDLA